MAYLTFLRRLASAIKGAVMIFKHGGVCTASIFTSSYSNVLEGKSVLVTGGSSGIGFAIASKCIQAGATVVITGRNELKLREAVKGINSPKCQYLVWDISKVEDCNKHISKCKELMGGKIDILVNNAGVAPSKFFGDIDELEWDRIYNTNLKGNYFLTQEIVKQWRSSQFSGYKKIINISSQGGFVGATYPYRMTKWDIRGLTEGLGKLLIEDKIIVNGIAPGVVKTSMQEFSLQQGENIYTGQNPVKRVCLPEEIAELALFLISDVSNFIIGQTIVCDGGFILK